MNIVVTLLLIAGLLLANAFFVASEFCLISSRRDRIESLVAQGKPAAKRVLHATEHLSIMLAGSQFGITICSLVLGKVAEPAVAHFIEVPFQALGLPSALLHPLAFAIALAIITFLHILFGEMVPKNIAIAGPETLAMWLAPGIIGWVKITRPFIEFLNWLARVTLHAMGIEQQDELDSTVDQDQLATMITESRAEGYLDAEEHARLNKALRSDDRSLKEIMVPLSRVRSLDYGTQGPMLGQLEELLQETGFSRFPITGRDGSYLGYVHVKDVLDRLSVAEITEAIPRDRLRPLITVDAAQPLDEALNILHQRNAHMAQVRERGELTGIVFLEDLIEEYVGTVNDWTHEEA